MGLNVGGIHVRVKEGVTQGEVTARIEAFWQDIGASVSDADALDVEPLSLEKTGDLGFLILPAVAADDGEEWIAVYDSERYRADPALARDLAAHFGTDVWHWEFHDATNAAYAKRYGSDETVVRGDRVEGVVSGLPASLLYFNQIRETLPQEALDECRMLRFAGVPHRPKAKYSGPSPGQLASNELTVRARALAEKRDAAALRELAGEHQVYWEVVKPAVESADLTDDAGLRFALALGDVVVEQSGHNRTVAEAALRAGDEALFERAMQKLATYQATLMEAHACRLGQAGESRLAFRMLEAITRAPSATQTSWNNAVYFLLSAGAEHGLSEERIAALFAGAAKVGPTNPPIFHNLACAYVRLGRHDDALDAIEAAARYGYAMDRIENDPDLDPVRSNARFAAAVAAQPSGGIEHLVIERGYKQGTRCIVRPAVGMSLFFASTDAPPAVADLIARLFDEMPEMFAFFRPANVLGMDPTKKGKVKRDLTALRKNEASYGYSLQYDDAGGEACERRVYFEHGNDGRGELDLCLPLALADEPDALFEQLCDYAQLVPFEWGNAGYTLCPYEVGNLVGPATDAHAEIARLAPDHLGLCLSPSQLGHFPDPAAVSPSWLTFLSARRVERLPPGWRERLGDATLTELTSGAVVIRAARAPFVGRGTAPTDLGALPAIARALSPLLPRGERGWAAVEGARMAAIAALGA